MTQEKLARAARDYEPPANYKDPVKIEQHKQDFLDNLAERHKFRVGGARIVGAALGEITSGAVKNIEGKVDEDPSAVAKFIVDYLDEYPSLRFVGYNITGFDLPILTHALHKANLRLRSPQGKWDPIDLMFHFKGYGMKDLAEAFGIEAMKDAEGNTLDGSAVKGLYDLGEFDTILKYVKHDVKMEGELYLALSRMYKLE